MKTFFLAMILTGAHASGAPCPPTSPAMRQYFEQGAAAPHEIRSKDGKLSIPGYRSPKGEFRFGSLSRAQRVDAEVSPSKVDGIGLARFCKERAEDRWRFWRAQKKTQFEISVRYLPEFKGLTNDPWKDQSFAVTSAVASLAAPSETSYVPEKIAAEFTRQLKKQASAGAFSLTTRDTDVACDLALGTVVLNVTVSATSVAALAERTTIVDPRDVNEIYGALKSTVTAKLTPEKIMFFGGRAVAELKEQGRISVQDVDPLLGITREMIGPRGVREMDDADLRCLADRSQSYTLPTVSHKLELSLQVARNEEGDE